MTQINILIGTPSGRGQLAGGMVGSLMALVEGLRDTGIMSRFVCIEAADLIYARSTMATLVALRPEFTHLLFIDDDMTFEFDAVLSMLRADKPLIGCISPRRTIDLKRFYDAARKNVPYDMAIAQSLDFITMHIPDKETKIVEGLCPVGGIGMGAQIEKLRRGVDILVATPGRLLDHAGQGTLDLGQVQILVLDEADRMLDMGFAPQINRVVEQIPAYRQTLLFSATMPPEVEALARKYLRRPIVVQVGRRSSAAVTVAHAVYPVPAEKKVDLLVHLLRRPEMDSVLVFTRTKHGADKVVRNLEKNDIASTAMHADKTQAQRIKALEGFRDGTIRVLVATDIAQRGLDINGISHVINYDVPQQAEDYVHRIGRTGRAAASGDAVTFMAPDEIAMVRTIERVIGQQIPRVSVPGYDFGSS